MTSSFRFFLIFAVLAISEASFADIAGTWQGKEFEFKVWSSDIDGHWGDNRYDLNFWSSNIDGILARQKFDVDFWSSDIEGTLPCGNFDINIWAWEVDGHICEQKFDIETSSKEESVEVAYDLAISSVLEHLPLPARAPIKREIDRQREKKGWMKR